MHKNELRAKYKALREDLSESDIEELSLQIANQSLTLDIWKFEYYHIFLSIAKHKEINTEYLLQIIFGKDANVVVPKVKDTELKHYLLTDSTKLKLSKWGIPEPEKGIEIGAEHLDVVFMPLLAYDKTGNRIGYGKGFYDKFLSACRPETLKIGLSFFEPEDQNIEASKHDIKLDYCVSPKSIYRF
ncbi:5-formyltetrahydrofolate cyclo-ligase [Psychroflexus sp. CAK57W]|uniref:5-formyltetrahydrofolate cyclo-ligase n=1 Tax=Psychroflexus curvus TaxID=2873595 RepID=UPI001CCF0B4D|nr:5-formyltetrahydrofolate cyclo-ligase [Psychroflexus curvus]MBZ9629015.1 5-formyltetrahydrofolate cyclo-ligase [Psychroflexus curvus]MBZ9787398.1 5-formyltetrahydrofolate cyclo-ligase [Psychroflexus curvus]